ncbi:hypothetical protein IQ235_07005 [Oscillatoriales cyanobacterium LEGE 11467]|uniref:Uncharacterized protein n=1 Tax=Zarconia navalis LEGE 11467 TaxID=1828826 RepID=A0A928VUF9_9CYAN|nr:hypothetical protein [Zarconia navalis LEGE 11467]
MAFALCAEFVKESRAIDLESLAIAWARVELERMENPVSQRIPANRVSFCISFDDESDRIFSSVDFSEQNGSLEAHLFFCGPTPEKLALKNPAYGSRVFFGREKWKGFSMGLYVFRKV